MQNLEEFITGSSRNKLIITTSLSNLVKSVDVGALFSTKIQSLIDDSRLSLKAVMILEELFETNINQSDKFGRYLALHNLGILFEPELKIDFLSLIDKYSRNNALFIHWEGEIENEILFFLSNQKGQKINIKNLSHIII